MSVLSGLILEKIYEIFFGTNETVHNIRVSVVRGFIVFRKKKNSIFVREIGMEIYLLTFFVVAVYLFFLLVYYLVFGETKMSLSMGTLRLRFRCIIFTSVFFYILKQILVFGLKLLRNSVIL